MWCDGGWEQHRTYGSDNGLRVLHKGLLGVSTVQMPVDVKKNRKHFVSSFTSDISALVILYLW